MKRAGFIAVLIVFFTSLSAQVTLEELQQQFDSIRVEENESQKLPIQFHSSFGTSFMYSPYFGSGMNFMFAPHASYPLSNRLSIHAGVLASHTVSMQNYTSSEFPMQNNFSTMSLFVAGSYRVTDKLTVHGAGIQSLYGPIPAPGMQSYNYRDLSVGATYDFGNFSIGATIHTRNGNQPFSPYGISGPVYGNPFYW